MNKYIPDLVGSFGFISFITGIYLKFGVSLALILAGLLMLAYGIKAK